MAEQKKHFLPGTDVVGRGIYLRPHQPYVLKDYLFPRNEVYDYYLSDTDSNFSVPKHYAVNSSTPMPINRMLNQTLIEESWELLDKQMGLDANLAASVEAFSVDAQSNQSKHLRSEKAAYYALRSSFIPLWTVYIPNALRLSKTTSTDGMSSMDSAEDLPEAAIDETTIMAPFKHKHRRQYERFFARYGTHYVRRAWVGGKATLIFIVSESAGLSKEQVQAGIKASYIMLGSTNAQGTFQSEKEKLLEQSECQIFGKGGDELKLASLNSLDENAYNKWVESIKKTPGVIELDVIGIWTLISDPEKAKALQAAYRTTTVFRPISAIFRMNEKVYFLRGNKYFYYDIETNSSVKPNSIVKLWPCLAEKQFERIDAALTIKSLHSDIGEKLQQKLYFFKDTEYIRLSIDERRFDVDIFQNITDESLDRLELDGIPDDILKKLKEIDNHEFMEKENFLELLKERLGVEKAHQHESLILQHAKMAELTIDEGYPKQISDGWPGVPFERIDAALNIGGHTGIYLFSGQHYVRFNIAQNRVDDGYQEPQRINERWAGVSFERIDAAIAWEDGKVYFFREDEYIRYDMTLYRADPGYPKPLIGEYAEDWSFFSDYQQ
ncbi:MAG: hypothetical protein ETSY2_16640 [Candidatus Entotheonella gemina]|uniref:MACPF domain-containing protein n=1 Tax=Candidatus Entotheonella gemina TaxID=1429439 RepID=W4M8K1_9BACT|nr:MAG: hypothetical protein ETSY2_16640 [Candidatus Entotheonella gemina]